MYEPACPTDAAVVRTWNMDVRVGSLKRLMLEFNGKGMNIKGLWLTEFGGLGLIMYYYILDFQNI